jgi:hypothetical protein
MIMGGSEWVFGGDGRLYDLGGEFQVETYGPPEPIRWVSIDDLGQVFGQPVAIAKRHGIVYDHYAVSEVYESNGGRYVNLVHAAHWWNWMQLDPTQRPPQVPRAVVFATRHVWVQQRTGDTRA